MLAMLLLLLAVRIFTVGSDLLSYHINDPLLLISEEVGAGWGERHTERIQIEWYHLKHT